MKSIKFDLPINGTKVKNLEELRDNLTDEILILARSSQLERWLRTRQLPEQAQAVATAVRSEGTDKDLFLALCGVLEVEVHPGDVRAIFDAPLAPGKFISGARYAELYEQMKQQLEEMKKEVDRLNTQKINSAILNAEKESRQMAFVEAEVNRRLINFGNKKEIDKSISPAYGASSGGLTDLLRKRAMESSLDNKAADVKNTTYKNDASEKKFFSSKKILDVKFTNKCFGGLLAFQSFDFANGGGVVNVFIKKGNKVVKGSLVVEVINRSSLERIYSPVTGYVEKVFFEVGGHIKIGGDLFSVVESEA